MTIPYSKGVLALNPGASAHGQAIARDKITKQAIVKFCEDQLAAAQKLAEGEYELAFEDGDDINLYHKDLEDLE